MKSLVTLCLLFFLITLLPMQSEQVKVEGIDCNGDEGVSGAPRSHDPTELIASTELISSADLMRVYTKSDIFGQKFFNRMRVNTKSDIFGQKVIINSPLYFDDAIEIKRYDNISKIGIHYTDAGISGLETTYHENGGHITLKHLGNISNSVYDEIVLEKHDLIRSLRIGMYDHNITSLSIGVTNTVSNESVWLSVGLHKANSVTELNGTIKGFFGNIYHGRLSGLGVYVVKESEIGPKFGGPGGKPWTDPILNTSLSIVGIRKIVIYHGDSIDAIQVDYITPTPHLVIHGDKHGGSGGSPTTIDIQDDQVLVGMETKSSKNLLGSVTFIVKSFTGKITKYGPFGSPANDNVMNSVNGRITGFYGSEGDVLDSLGVYTMIC